MRRCQVNERRCNLEHPECTVRWSGREEYYHRHSSKTIVAAELPLRAFQFFIDTKGPGMESFVRTTELDYAFADSPADENGIRFMCVDTFRHVFDSYFCRTDFDANRPCPTCPVLRDPQTGEFHSDCKNLTADGQRIRLRKKELGRAPNAPRTGAPVVDCRQYSQACERLAWPPGGPSTTNGKARIVLAKVCGFLLDTHHAAPDSQLIASVQELQEIWKGADFTGYWPAISLVLGAFEKRVRQENATLSDFEHALTSTMACVAHSQTEATQFIPVDTHAFLKEVLQKSSTSGFTSKDKHKWAANIGIRRSLIHLAWVGKENRGGGQGDPSARVSSFQLGHVTEELFRTLDSRVQGIQDRASQSMHQRVLFKHDHRPSYDPSCGEAYFFSSSGQPLASWPNFENVKGEKNCESCDHPDWYRTGRNSMSEGIMTLACLGSYTIRGFHFMLGHEAKADAAGGIYSYAKNPPDTVILDTPCQHAPYVNSRIGFFYLTQFVCDRFHGIQHTCKRIFSANEFPRFDATNTSFIEQYHSFQKILKSMVAGATREHATFYVCLLIDHHYNSQCDDLKSFGPQGVPEERRRWPAHSAVDPRASSYPSPSDVSASDGTIADGLLRGGGSSGGRMVGGGSTVDTPAPGALPVTVPIQSDATITPASEANTTSNRLEVPPKRHRTDIAIEVI